MVVNKLFAKACCAAGLAAELPGARRHQRLAGSKLTLLVRLNRAHLSALFFILRWKMMVLAAVE
ncbi:hypothetical protein A3224_10355 [Microbulbifer thermotolerans]|uniref:Uncharacterized protein n=1 Tax=Microbulbifer thermotolerans TaxID=252514 RepID=A0A143HNS4_MICTH|nr:hypothetical protein A3224_10355 [Microbulbifer thermotolerans]